MSTIWPPGWRDVGDDHDAIVAVIREALAPGHILNGRRFTVLARREDQDDLLLLLDDGEVAEMHIAWAKQVTPDFPGAMLYPDLAHWQEAQF
jgi:hypothetical protein